MTISGGAPKESSCACPNAQQRPAPGKAPALSLAVWQATVWPVDGPGLVRWTGIPPTSLHPAKGSSWSQACTNSVGMQRFVYVCGTSKLLTLLCSCELVTMNLKGAYVSNRAGFILQTTQKGLADSREFATRSLEVATAHSGEAVSSVRHPAPYAASCSPPSAAGGSTGSARQHSQAARPIPC